MHSLVVSPLNMLAPPREVMSSHHVKADLTAPEHESGYQIRRNPVTLDFATSRVTCITVRHASVNSPWRDIAKAMCRVTTGRTSLADCNRFCFFALAIA